MAAARCLAHTAGCERQGICGQGAPPAHALRTTNPILDALPCLERVLKQALNGAAAGRRERWRSPHSHPCGRSCHERLRTPAASHGGVLCLVSQCVMRGFPKSCLCQSSAYGSQLSDAFCRLHAPMALNCPMFSAGCTRLWLSIIQGLLQALPALCRAAPSTTEPYLEATPCKLRGNNKR